MSDLKERQKTVLNPTDTGDHDLFAHYVNKKQIMDSYVTGAPCFALCGKVWVPGRDTNGLQICPTCIEIYHKLQPGDDSDQDNGH